MTNYEWIKNMSIEEMAIFFADEVPHGDCYGCDKCSGRECPYKLDNACQDGWLEYLESEAVQK